MFEAIKNIFRDKSHYIIEKTKSNVKRRNDEFDFGLLGRSLSINPYPPRGFDFDFHPLMDGNIIKVIEIDSEDNIFKLPSNLGVIVATTSLKNDISLIATLRRYSPFLIIHNDIFISKYQLLESVVYGADIVVLDVNILDMGSITLLCDFASHLGLMVALKGYDSSHKDILNNIDFILLDNLDSRGIINNTDKMILYIESLV